MLKAEWLKSKINQTVKSKNNALTDREFECLRYLLEGFSAKEIAREIGISPRTIELHIHSIRQKTGSRTTLQLLAKLLKIAAYSPFEEGVMLDACHG